jgi:hypothetical protein
MLQVPFRTIMEDKSDLICHVGYSTKTADVESESNITTDNNASVVKLYDSVISTAHIAQHIPDFHERKIKTESIIHDHQACDDYNTHDYAQQTMESNRICVKHEYKYEEDSTHMSHTVTSVVVKSEMSDDSGMSTTQFPHNV